MLVFIKNEGGAKAAREKHVGSILDEGPRGPFPVWIDTAPELILAPKHMTLGSYDTRENAQAALDRYFAGKQEVAIGKAGRVH